jgi:hypothetical protein
MAKLSLAPVSPELVALKDRPVDLEHKPNGLRGAVVDFMTENAAEWELRVQLCTDLQAMPIEDATVEWTSPWVAVAPIMRVRRAVYFRSVQPQPDHENDGPTTERPECTYSRCRCAGCRGRSAAACRSGSGLQGDRRNCGVMLYDMLKSTLVEPSTVVKSCPCTSPSTLSR